MLPSYEIVMKRLQSGNNTCFLDHIYQLAIKLRENSEHVTETIAHDIIPKMASIISELLVLTVSGDWQEYWIISLTLFFLLCYAELAVSVLHETCRHSPRK